MLGPALLLAIFAAPVPNKGPIRSFCPPITVPMPGGAGTATYPCKPLTYPMTSDRYSVQYSIDGSKPAPATVSISYYGGTNASPLLSYSGYSTDTSMSFVSIPARANATVALTVTILGAAPRGKLSVRPRQLEIEPKVSGETVTLSLKTDRSFKGEQFILWSDAAAGDGWSSSSIRPMRGRAAPASRQ